jgi:hypothetical protein
MAKAKKKQKKSKPVKAEIKKPFSLSHTYQDLIFLALIVIILIVLLKPLVIDGLSPQGVDVLAARGKTHQITKYQKESGEDALWNPAIFAGMPIYHRKNAVTFSVDTILNTLGKLLNSVFIYYLFAAFGIYLLLRFLKMPPLISFIATMMFILMPHYKSLYTEGHFAKFRALMILPWVVVSFLYFLKQRTILSVALFALAFGIQIRTQHYQVVFYTGLLIFAVGIYPFVKDLVDKKFSTFTKSSTLLLVAIVLSITMAAQPLFLANEYLPYSKRGKTTIDISSSVNSQQTQETSDGVTMEYATRWSTHPSELLTWLIPRFYGGMSAEKYSGTNVTQLHNRMVPTYWGYMPFTQSYEYMGVITLLLAAIGIIAFRKNKLILSLSLFALFLILLSFGRHFQVFYSLFYNYVPYFNKFRAPMMSVTVTFFIVSILAAFGLKYLLELNLSESIKKHKNVLIPLAVFFALGLLLLIIGQSFSFSNMGDNYDARILSLIKDVRKEFFTMDVLRYLLLLLLAGLTIHAYLKQKLSFYIAGIILAVLTIFDLTNIQSRIQKDYINADKVENQYFKKSVTDEYILADPELSRICPIGNLFTDNRWAYYHYSIGGYTPIKMYTIEELVENNLYNGWDKSLPLNWNVFKILNTKYILSQNKLEHDKLKLVHSDQRNNIYTYLFQDYLPRGYCVGRCLVIEDEYERLQKINSAAFNPAKVAVLEEELQEEITTPDSSFSEVTHFNPNNVGFNVFTNTKSLFVISEVHYPPGWKIYMDGQQVDKVYRTNHAVQSIIIPAGEHKIDLRFEPDSYYNDIRMACFSLGILYIVIAISLIINYKEKLVSLFSREK